MPTHTTMSSLRRIQTTHTRNASCKNNLSQLAQRHGGDLHHNHNRRQPYATSMKSAYMALPQITLPLPRDLMDKVMNTREEVVSKTTQAKEASRLREFLQFCEGHGIKSSNAFPATEDLLVAWAASFSGQLAGKTVSAKLRAIRKEHERRGLVWHGGVLLRRILKGVEELRPVSSLNNKRAPVSISMLEDLNRKLTAAGDVKPATSKKTVDSESDDSNQPSDKVQPIIIEDSFESDSEGDVKVANAVSAVNGCGYHSHTFMAKS